MSLSKLRRSYFSDLATPPSSDYYDPSNEEQDDLRMEMLEKGLESAFQYLQHHGEVVILDGTHISNKRRKVVERRVEESGGVVDLVWVESLAIDEDVIEKHMEFVR